ncbi:hypothetical protein GQ651_00790 [Alphaproteobacteria bacterium GH1-50]|uniref:Type IV pilus biogenesis protein PilP n=1 Tax=Kangsaoukella pontilimi TaxID=2691042 RepID=A0A7C9MBB5_9RHOB|nr:hypothetical protein [Kangsaoukella pontilimi]MXQ06372.1 hypothetical protein [Kangsaoukella pontilimi]
MTQRWGFDLSMSAVRLMRRDAGYWREIAVEPIEGADIEERLQTLADQVDGGHGVDIFLPRDQILYTDVKVTDADTASREIEAAMEGRTPYALSELEIDWVIGPDNMARVAAVARETLEEAELFAAGRGLSVNRFSSLSDDEDFPRQPDFGMGKDALPPAEEPVAEPAFASRREPAPAAAATVTVAEAETPAGPVGDDAEAGDTSGEAAVPVSVDSDAPVVRVDDAEPVMQVVAERPAPLDPGPALPRPSGAPRVRTDLALSEGGGDVAASLAPAGGEKYGRTPVSSAQRVKVLAYGVAAVLTLGIGAIVWSILPGAERDTGQMSPELSEPSPAPALPPLPETDTAALHDDVAPVVPDLTAELSAPVATDEVPATPGDMVSPERAGALADLVTPPSDVPGAPRPLEILPTPPVVVAAGPADLVAPETTEVARVATPHSSPRTFPGSVALPTPTELAPDSVIAAGIPPEPRSSPVLAEATDTSDAQPAAETVVEAEPAAEADEADTAVALAERAEPDAAEVPEEIGTAETALLAEDAEDQVTPEASATDTDVAGAEVSPTEPAEASERELPRPTELAQSLPERRPGARPTDLRQEIERQRFGGRTVAELSRIRPGRRPESAQSVAVSERGNATPSALAVETAFAPRGRPGDMETIVAAARQQARAAEVAALDAPDTSAAVRAALADTDLEPEDDPTSARNSPRLAIPSDANVARRATVEEAMRLNRINLVGVYGLPSDRRALIRLPSGRYVKVKVGDRIDGGTVAAIGDSALQYRKGGRTIQLSMPQG